MLRLALLLLLAALPARADRVFVLVHGAWVGGWYWDPVLARLRENGADVAAVTLEPLRQGSVASLADHVATVVAAVEATGSDEVILVAHSAGARAATGAWDQKRDRIVRVVYVEALPPDIRGPVALLADTGSLAWLALNYPDILSSGLFPVPATIAPAYRDRARPHPIDALFGAVRPESGPLPEIPLTYVLASRGAAPAFRRMAEPLRADPRWTVVEIDAGHDVVADAPDALADLLLSFR